MNNERICSKLNVRDTLNATVIGSCKTGIFLLLENGEEAFSRFNYLCEGTKVLCSVKRLESELKNLRVLVEIESVLNYTSITAA